MRRRRLITLEREQEEERRTLSDGSRVDEVVAQNLVARRPVALPVRVDDTISTALIEQSGVGGDDASGPTSWERSGRQRESQPRERARGTYCHDGCRLGSFHRTGILVSR